MAKLTLEELLKREKNDVLLDVQLELLSGIVPATGAAHEYCRKVNKMIDMGECCINQSTYRKVYIPSLAKAVQRELARRFTRILLGKDIVTRQPCELTQQQLETLFTEGYNIDEI